MYIILDTADTQCHYNRWQEYRGPSTDSFREIVQHIVRGPKGTHEQSSLFNRLAVLEARASKRVLYWVLFLPFMFFIFGAVLGKFVINPKIMSLLYTMHDDILLQGVPIFRLTRHF